MAIRGTLTDLDEHKLENAFETLRDMYIDAKREGGNKIVYVTVQVNEED